MKTTKELREERAVLFDRAEAIVQVAREEQRELKDDEKAEIDGILGVGRKGADDYRPGKLDALDADIERAERFEARQAELAASRQTNASAALVQQAAGPDERRTFAIPAAARRHRKLKAFDNPEDAYAAGQWYLAVLAGHDGAAAWCREHGLAIRNALGTGDNSKGGVLVPDVLERSIISLREERGVFRRESRNYPMSSDHVDVPRRTGGVTAYFTSENGEITPSDKSWDSVGLTARKLAVLTKWPSELDQDAIIDLAEDLTQEIGYAFADKEDLCGFNGDGTSTYGGIVGLKNALAAGSEYEAIAGNTAFSTLDLDDFTAMVGKVPDYALDNSKWYISRAGWGASMLRLMEAAGGNTVQSIAGSVPPSFLGFPVVWVNVMNSTLGAQTSTKGLVYFGDLRQAALLGDRRGVSLMVSAERYFETDQLAIRGTQRFDINIHERGSATVPGSIVGLKTPGS